MADAFSSGQFVFPSEYGYVIWAGALTFVINFVQTFYIGQVRTHSYPRLVFFSNSSMPSKKFRFIALSLNFDKK